MRRLTLINNQSTRWSLVALIFLPFSCTLHLTTPADLKVCRGGVSRTSGYLPGHKVPEQCGLQVPERSDVILCP